jgi:PleD family two-component response regulator
VTILYVAASKMLRGKLCHLLRHVRPAGNGLSAVPLGELTTCSVFSRSRNGKEPVPCTIVLPANPTMKCNSVTKGGILVIDDDPATLADLTRILSMGGYTCHCCRDVDSAVAQFHETPPRLVIADLGLVGPNGYRWNEALSREIGHVDVPLMFLSNAQHPDIIHRHSDSGGAYYLRKPIEVVVLLELVDKALWNRRLAGAAF